jgi:hypothetical protein
MSTSSEPNSPTSALVTGGTRGMGETIVHSDMAGEPAPDHTGIRREPGQFKGLMEEGIVGSGAVCPPTLGANHNLLVDFQEGIPWLHCWA